MKRPRFLTVWLILIAIADVFSLFSYTFGASSITRALPNFPSWAFLLYDVGIVLQLICVVLLWRWKKIGFYLIAAGALVVAVLNVAILGAAGIGGIILGLVGVGILYLAMRPVWEQFT
jgi:hypothetical protein